MLPPAESQKATLLYFSHAAAKLLFDGETRHSTGEPAADLGESSLAAYRSAWGDFEEWQLQRGRVPLPASGRDVARFLVARGDLSRSTLKKRRAAIGFVHRGLRLPSPTETPQVDLTWEVLNEKKKSSTTAVGEPSRDEDADAVLERSIGLLRERQAHTSKGEEKGKGERPFTEDALRFIPFETPKPGALTERQRKIIPQPKYDLGALRDRAILLLGATAKLKRRELVDVRVEDVLVTGAESGLDVDLLIGIRRASGEAIYDRALGLWVQRELRFDTARAVAAWIVGASLREGPLARSFTPQGTVRDKGMSSQALNDLIKRRARQAGLPASEWSAKTLKEVS